MSEENLTQDENFLNENELGNTEWQEKEHDTADNLASLINHLSGTWSYPGNFESVIVIEAGCVPNEISVRDLTRQHWSEGTGIVSVDASDDRPICTIDMSFDTGVSVAGTLSDDLTAIHWENETVWHLEA